MSLKKYNCCDQVHSSDFQYVCLKEKRVFCIKCWFKLEHFRHCQSSRCGQYNKIAHLALNRALQYKNSKILEEMCASHSSYEALRVRFLQLNFQVTEILKDFVQQKMPLLFWGMANQLLRKRYGSQAPPNFNKFDSYCTQMLKIIKSNDNSQKQDYLQSAIGAYYDINHQLEGELYQIRNSGFTKNINKQEEVNEVIDKTKTNLFGLLNNIKKGFRDVMDLELKKTTKNIDEGIEFKGVTFQKITPETECFRKREQYPYLNLIAQKYSKLSNQEVELHMGFNMNLGELESIPEQLLHVGKCLIKEKLHQCHESITTVKSVFPYKYAYPISTTLSQDQQYEQLLIDLERAAIDASQKTNPFVSSLNLIIMGKQVIIIRFFNHSRFYYTRKIYNYKKKREEYYDVLIQKLGLKGIPTKSGLTPDKIQYNEELTDVELAYCNFRVAYENIFEYDGEDLIFEGERVMANRGAEQLQSIIEKWRKTANIDFSFTKPFVEMIKYLV